MADEGGRKGFFRRRVMDPLGAFLTQGVTPRELALSAALGSLLGVIPVLGSTTALCALAAAVLRLNMLAIQLVNNLVYPFQLLLLIPFLEMGRWIFHAPPLGLSLGEILDLVRAHPWEALGRLWTATWHGMAAWALVAPPAGWAVYQAVFLFLTKTQWKNRRPK